MSDPQTASLGIEVDSSAVERAADAFERLQKAIEGVSEALAGLDGKPHGGIEFKMVGAIAICNVKPAA